MEFQNEINKLKEHAKRLKFDVELREGTYGVCNVNPKRVIVPTSYGDWQTVIIFAHELGHAEQFRYRYGKGVFKTLGGCKSHYRSIHRSLNKTMFHEVEAWIYAWRILKENNISRKNLLKIAAYSLNNKTKKQNEKLPYVESWPLVVKVAFKIIGFYFKYYRETKTFYRFNGIT